MTTNQPIVGTMILSPNARGVPVGGLVVSSLRVEVAAGQSAPPWLAELVIQGDLPWKRGEERHVEVRIMSDEFRRYVTAERPALVVTRGAESLGTIVLG